MALWRLLNFVGLAGFLEGMEYWPPSSSGQLATKMHPHKLGDREEIGVFLEEIMFQHFFLFRRFPFPSAVQRICEFGNLSGKDHARTISAITGMINRSAMIEGKCGQRLILKENEANELLMSLARYFRDAKFIFVYRSSEEMSSSYQSLSLTSTMAKTEIEPARISKWQEVNDEFRVKQSRMMIALYEALPKECRRVVHYDELSSDPEPVVIKLFNWLGEEIDDDMMGILSAHSRKQKVRESGYANNIHVIRNIEFFDAFFLKQLLDQAENEELGQ